MADIAYVTHTLPNLVTGLLGEYDARRSLVLLNGGRYLLSSLTPRTEHRSPESLLTPADPKGLAIDVADPRSRHSTKVGEPAAVLRSMGLKVGRLGACERRAIGFCDTLHNLGHGAVVVEWKKSSTWGLNPSIDCGGKTCVVSGCGYDKLSTVLALTLRFLGTTPDDIQRIERTAGAGESETIRALRECGWELEPSARGQRFDAYSVRKV